MSIPVNLRGNHSHLFGSSQLPVLEAMFKWELAQYSGIRDRLANMKKTDRDIVQSSEIADMPMMQEVAEGEDYTYSRPRQGASKTVTIKKYGLGFTISEEMIDDGKFDFVGFMVSKLARSAKESQEISFVNMFNNGFTASTGTLTPDGQPLFDTAHTLPSGSTFRNELSTSADLSPSSLETALQDYDTQFIGDTGIIYRIQPKILLVHQSQVRYAQELVGSTNKPDSADNNINSLAMPGLTVVASPHLTDTDAWFLLSDKADHGLEVWTRKPIETKAAGPDAGFDNDSIKYKTRYREQVNARHAYGVFGSPGA